MKTRKKYFVASLTRVSIMLENPSPRSFDLNAKNTTTANAIESSSERRERSKSHPNKRRDDFFLTVAE